MKKIGFLLIFTALIYGLVFVSAAEKKQGEDITEKVQLNYTVGIGTSPLLLDRNVETACHTTDKFELKINSAEPIYGVYFMWNEAPPLWTLTGENETVTGGEKGFWHEYKATGGGLEYTLTWEGKGELAEVWFLSEGKVPDFVQVWEKPCEKADFLLLPTHADDEHLWFGGTMPYYAGELGLNVQVVYLMKHVSGRHHELLNGLWHVGVTNYPVISEFIDKYSWSLEHAKTLYPEEEVLAFLVENIRRFKPEVILGHDLDGEYGHGAHILNATVLSERALTAANDPQQCPESAEKYGTWETKKCYLHLYHENKIFIDWKSMSLSAFGGKSAYDMAQEGFNQHISQRTFFTMSLDVEEEHGNGLFGLFSTTVGPDVLKNDLLENIPANCLSNWVEPAPESSEAEPEIHPSVTDTHSESDTSSEWRASEVLIPPTVLWGSVGIGLLSVICIVVLIFVFRKKHLK